MPTSSAKKPADRKKKTAPVELETGDFVTTTSKGRLTLTRYSQLPFGTLRKVQAIQEKLTAAVEELDERDEDAARLIEAQASMAEVEVILVQLDAATDKKARDLIDRLPQREVGDIYQRWQKHSEVELGESSASSDS